MKTISIYLAKYVGKGISYITIGEFGASLWMGQLVFVLIVLALTSLAFRGEELKRWKKWASILGIVEMISILFA